MAYTYRLSRRLAQIHISLAALLILACTDRTSDLASGPDNSSTSVIDASAFQSSAISSAFAPASSVGCTNEPSGYTTFTNQPWNAIPPLPPTLDIYGWRNSTSKQSRLKIVSDPTAPGSPASLMEGIFVKGTRGGTGPFNLEFKFGRNVTRVYQCVWHKLSSNFTSNGNSNVKFGFLLSPYYSGNLSINHFLNLTPALGVHLQSSNLVLNRQMKSNWKMLNNLGGWHKFEFLVVANAKGLSNGIARIWVDGNQVLDVTDVKYFHASQTPIFNGITWNPTYGGGTNPVPYDMFEWVDNWYVSGQ